MLQNHEGHLAAHSSVQMEIIFSPSIKGDVNTVFCVKFDDADSAPVSGSGDVTRRAQGDL